MYSILAKILSNIYIASHVYFEMIDQRVRNESSPRVIPSSFIYNVLHRSHSCVTWIAISIAGVHVSSSSTQMLFAEEASQITRHYRGLSFLLRDWPWQTNLSSLLSSPDQAWQTYPRMAVRSSLRVFFASIK